MHGDRFSSSLLMVDEPYGLHDQQYITTTHMRSKQPIVDYGSLKMLKLVCLMSYEDELRGHLTKMFESGERKR